MIRDIINRSWRWSLGMGALAAIFGLMAGLFVQTAFYEIASSIPFIVQQDAHVSLFLCEKFPSLYGCDAWVGALTNLEIWQLSLYIGQATGLVLNFGLVVYFSLMVTIRLGIENPWHGLFIGIAGLFMSLLLAIAFDVPVNTSTPWGIFSIAMLILLPIGGAAGGRSGSKFIAKSLKPKYVFIPSGMITQVDGTIEPLSDRELEVLVLLAEGLTNKGIAQRLYITNATVKTHLIHIFSKLNVENRTAAVTQAIAIGLLEKKGSQTPVS